MSSAGKIDNGTERNQYKCRLLSQHALTPTLMTILYETQGPDIYSSSNIAVFEPSEFQQAEKDDKWMETMKEELKMIKKNDTWDNAQKRKVTGV